MTTFEKIMAGVPITDAGTGSATAARGAAAALGQLEASRGMPPTGELAAANAVPPNLSLPAGSVPLP